MKYFFIIFFFLISDLALSNDTENIRTKLDILKKQTVKLHNEIISNNKDLKKINIDINKNKQKQLILKKYIQDKENIVDGLVFLMREKIYLSQINTFVKNLYEQSDDFISKQIIRKFFLQQTQFSINTFFSSLEQFEELENDLENKKIIFRDKKTALNKKLKKLEVKISEVAFLQKKMKVDKSFKKNQKSSKKNAKNLNDLVKGVQTKKKKKKNKLTRKIQMPIQGKIVSEFGEGKDLNKSKYGLVFDVLEDSFITSPIDGTVVFAGKFRSYGNLIIIENDSNLLTILSGMNKILISTGNQVFKGEPIAKIFVKSRNKVYFELRYKGKVIDPKSEVEIL